MANRQYTHDEMAQLIGSQIGMAVKIVYSIATDSYIARWGSPDVRHEMEFSVNDSYLSPHEFMAARQSQIDSHVNYVERPTVQPQVQADANSPTAR